MRLAVEADLPRIVEIYNSTVPTRLATADTEPVSVESRQAWFRAHNPDTRPCYVEQRDGEIVAWLSFESFYGRPAYHATAELSIYIDEKVRGGGLGSQLMQQALDLAPSLGLRNLVGYIFSHNQPSLQLFRKFGFMAWGELPDIAEMDGQLYSLTIMGRVL